MTKEEYQIELSKCKHKDCLSSVRIAYIAHLEAENEKMHTVAVELFKSRTACLKHVEELEEAETIAQSCCGCVHYFDDIDGDGCALYEANNLIKCGRQFSPDYYEEEEV